MPELPEVETIRKTLIHLVKDKTIDKIDIYWPKIIKRPDDIEHFKQILIGQTINDVERKGKFLKFILDDFVLVSHLRMEGKYRLETADIPLDKHVHVVFTFTDRTELRYHDVRKFGTMHVFVKGEELLAAPLKQLAPDPFEEDFSFEIFYQKLKRTTRFIKNVLLDQTVIAGLGNIYVDETLIKAGIHPLKRANELTENEARKIMEEAINTLREAVKLGGTTIRSYVDGTGEMGMFQQELFAYGQESKSCKFCATPIEKFKVSGRGTHICPSCQKLK